MFSFESLPLKAKLRVTSPFGSRVLNGVTENHKGIDLGGDRSKTQTEILCVKAGYVYQNYWNNSRGWVIVIKHDDKHMTLYQHMKYQSLLKVGDIVKAGQVIGVMGNTGYSTAAHLHMEMRVGNMPVNPYPYLMNIEEGITDMTKEEVIELIDNRIKQLLQGQGTNTSDIFKGDMAEAISLGITDGSRPGGYAKREEVVAMVMRGKKV